MLDETAPFQPEAPAEPDTAVSTQASNGPPQAAAKAAEAGQSAQNAPASLVVTAGAETTASDDGVKTAFPAPEQLEHESAAPQKLAPISSAEPQTQVPQKDEKAEPPVSDKPSSPTAIVAQTVTPAPNGVTPPAPVPAPLALPPGQALQPSGTPVQSSDNPALPLGLALVAPLARQISAGVKTTKQGQAPAQFDLEDQAQAAASTPEQPVPLLSGSKPVTALAGAGKPENVTDASHRSALDLGSTKSDAPQSIDDLLTQAGAQTDASPSSGAAASAGNQTGSAAPMATATTSAPQSKLAPVPLSGIPVFIAGKALAGSNHFDIRLDPPELGRIEVRLKVDRDGQVSSHLIADRADTLALLRRDHTGLERALQDAGLKTSGDGLQFSLRDQGGNAQPDARPAVPTLLVQDNSNPVTDLLPRGYASYVGRVGGIDIHV
jgi:flagellar hook-length control protein FliK